jgi:ATP-dependent phosphofructokinase / diphosphate-dependent phosphofructokinase
MIRRIGLLTGGGDCPGLNAVIRAVTLAATRHGIDVLGIDDGFLGLIENRTRPLHSEDVEHILARGGTILGASNKANPTRFATGVRPDGAPIIDNVLPACLERVRAHQLDALVVVGGDGSMEVAQPFVAAGLNCIGIPKTIDNDVRGTDLSFGFLSAVNTATEALDRVHTTAASHARVIAVEVMGRHAGWIALYAGIASASDMILLPEIPYDTSAIAEHLVRRRAAGKRYSVVCIAEGAHARGGAQVVHRIDPRSPDPVRLGGVSQRLAEQIEQATGIESRFVVLGHVQRGGPPIPTDRVLSTHFGHHAVRLLLRGARNRMVAWVNDGVTDVAIEIPAQGQKLVPADHPLITAAREIGVSFGDSLSA